MSPTTSWATVEMKKRRAGIIMSGEKDGDNEEDNVSDVGVFDASDGILEGGFEVLVVLLQAGLVVVQHEAVQAVVDAVRVGETEASFRLQSNKTDLIRNR